MEEVIYKSYGGLGKVLSKGNGRIVRDLGEKVLVQDIKTNKYHECYKEDIIEVKSIQKFLEKGVNYENNYIQQIRDSKFQRYQKS